MSRMKIGRNDLCPCGSGKKYKYCCLNRCGVYIRDGADEKTAIHNIVNAGGYRENVADVLYNLLRYMKGQHWLGACHATTAVMFVALCEMGFSPRACIGEVRGDFVGFFDHSWIELDGKIIDLACSMTLLDGQSASAPIIFDIDIYTGEQYKLEYGVNYTGLDSGGKRILNTDFCEYMDQYPKCKNGLWDVVSIILEKNVNVSELRFKYQTTQWNYVHYK